MPYQVPLKPASHTDDSFKLWLVSAENGESYEDRRIEHSIVWARSKDEAISTAMNHPDGSCGREAEAEEFAIYAGKLSFEHYEPCVLCFI